MEEVKVVITTNTPISVKVIQAKPDNGYVKLAERISKSEDKADAANQRKNG